MVFSSLLFLFLFLPLCLICYFLAAKTKRNTLRNGVLFVFSLFFYAWGEPVYVCLMLFSTLVDYIHGMLVDRHRGTPKAKIALISSMVINLGLLGVFKYSDFIVANINALFGLQIPLPNLPLPIGISFYTFQTMSYTIDVYRNDAKIQRNIISFGAYVSLFPQLIAGPIVRYSTISEQLDHRRESTDQFSEGVRRFVTGLAKKVLLADNIGLVWEQFSILGSSQLSVVGAWLGIIAFAFQIYFDFSGYSDMAIGLGKMFGFHFLENFDYPYVSKSITEFWRRWHISLGTWFREYVYIPLGGNRRGLVLQIRNIAIVWLLTGIWHGASWNFAMWGVYYGALLILEKLFLLKWLQKIPAFFSHLYTLFFVIIGWVIFAFDNFADGLDYLGAMFGRGEVPFIDLHAEFALTSNIVILAALILGSTPLPRNLYRKLTGAWRESSIPAIVTTNLGMVCLLVMSVAYLVSSSYSPFLYFRF